MLPYEACFSIESARWAGYSGRLWSAAAGTFPGSPYSAMMPRLRTNVQCIHRTSALPSKGCSRLERLRPHVFAHAATSVQLPYDDGCSLACRSRCAVSLVRLLCAAALPSQRSCRLQRPCLSPSATWLRASLLALLLLLRAFLLALPHCRLRCSAIAAEAVASHKRECAARVRVRLPALEPACAAC